MGGRNAVPGRMRMPVSVQEAHTCDVVYCSGCQPIATGRESIAQSRSNFLPRTMIGADAGRALQRQACASDIKFV